MTRRLLALGFVVMQASAPAWAIALAQPRPVESVGQRLAPSYEGTSLPNQPSTASSGQHQAPAPSYEEAPIGPPPAALGLDPFYTKHTDAGGIAIVSSEQVPDAALLAARSIVEYMVSARPDVRAAMIERGQRVGVMAQSEMQTDLPEYRDWKKPAIDDPRLTPRERERYNEPGGIASMTDREYWNRRARGMGGRYTTAAEENILGYPDTRYYGEHILVHEFSHAVMGALRTADPELYREIQDAYAEAKAEGRFKGHYAENTVAEYWAEGSQWWFWSNYEWYDGDTRLWSPDDLKAYDPRLYAIFERVYPGHRIPADIYHGLNLRPARRRPAPDPGRSRPPGAGQGGFLSDHRGATATTAGVAVRRASTRSKVCGGADLAIGGGKRTYVV